MAHENQYFGVHMSPELKDLETWSVMPTEQPETWSQTAPLPISHLHSEYVMESFLLEGKELFSQPESPRASGTWLPYILYLNPRCLHLGELCLEGLM